MISKKENWEREVPLARVYLSLLEFIHMVMILSDYWLILNLSSVAADTASTFDFVFEVLL